MNKTKKDKEKNKKSPKCDWQGKCKKKAFAEVYPFDVESSREKGYPVFINKGWSHLCFLHFVIAIIRGDTVAWCEVADKLTNKQTIVVKFLEIVVKLYAIARETRYFLSLYLYANIIYMR